MPALLKYARAVSEDHTDAKTVLLRGQNPAWQPDFLEWLGERHPELADFLRGLKAATTNKVPLGIERLNQLNARNRQQALFGDNPPPQQPASPYPDGDVVFQGNARVVIRHQYHGVDAVTKYTTVQGIFMGLDGDEPNEAQALRFIRKHTTIPVPEVLSSEWDRVTMTYIPGRTIKEAWPDLTSAQRERTLSELKGYIQQLRAVHYEVGGTKPLIGRLDGHGAVVPSIFTRFSNRQFSSMADFQQWLVSPPKRIAEESVYWHQITTQLNNDSIPVVFTHSDLAARNILVDNSGHITAILDWEMAGWYPAYWEYVFALYGLDNIDWSTLGSHLPSLFERRYDHEYILVRFILSIS